jgi:hypothetical protein
VIVDAAGENALVVNQEWAGKQNLAARAASVALTVASASDAGTILLGQHRTHDGTSDLASQLNQHPVLLLGPRASPVDFRTEDDVEGRQTSEHARLA